MSTQPPEKKGLPDKSFNNVAVDGAPNDRDEGGVDDAVVSAYATADRQRRLREKIKAQDLPVSRNREELSRIIEQAITAGNGIILLQGETGSGKSLYTPLIVRRLLDQLNRQQRVVVMQPRRDACSGVARAMAAIADETLGDTIGFSTSEMKVVKLRSQISMITPGIFLRHLMSGDLCASAVGAIIVDELHEGSIDYHLALGLMKLMHQTGELPPTVLTSATMNREGVQGFFDIPNDQYVRIEGRAHPVVTRYAEKAHEATQGKYEYIRLAAEEVKKACGTKSGDILVFMPGAREITDCIKQIGTIPGVEVIPLYGGLTPKDRDYALSGDKPSGIRRRVIVATNIAETSVTVPGVTLVVDTCRERSVRYNPKTGIQELGTGFISKDQAQQRAGRAGRVQPGECVRIVTKEQFDQLLEHPESEIRRSNLSHVILRLKRLGIEPKTFPFIEPPDVAALTGGEEELKALGALAEDASLTERGRHMGEMPFEPRIARMLIEAKERKCLEAALVLAAFEREGDVLMGPSRHDEEQAEGYDGKSKRLAARKKVQAIQKRFDRGGSDWLKALNVFIEALDNGVVEAMRRDHSPEGRVAQQRFRQWCDQFYIRAEALTHIAYRLQDYARYAGTQLDFQKMKKSLAEAKDVDLGCVILASHPDKILYLQSTGRGLSIYYPLSGGRGNAINMSPGSEGFDSQPKLCIAANISQGRGSVGRGAEIVRNYAHGIHPISFKVLREALPHMIEERRNSLRYDATSDQVVVEIVLCPKGNSSIELGKEDRVVEGVEATETFAQALAYGQIDLPCVEYNKKLLEQLQVLQQRSRGEVQPPTDMTAWYQEHLEGACRRVEAQHIDEQLHLQLADFYPEVLQQKTDRLYPETVRIRKEQLSVRYDYRAPQERWGEVERFSAAVTLTEEQLDLFEQTDIPQLGTAEQPVPLTLQVRIGWQVKTDTNIENLKDVLDTYRISQAWDKWGKPAAKPVVVELLQPLPNCAELGCEPIPYAQNRRREAVFAYPAITPRQEYDSSISRYTYNFYVQYYSNNAEAEQAQTNAVAKKAEMDATAQRRLDRETMLAPAQELYAQVEPRVTAMVEDYEQFGFSYREAQDLNRQLQEANMSIQGRDRWGSTVEIDSRKALELLRAIEQTLADRERSKQGQAELYQQAIVVRDRVQQIVTERLMGIRFCYYGLAEGRGRALQAQWDTAVRLLSKFTPGQTTDTFNPAEAMRVMSEIEQALMPLELNASPAQVAYLEMLEHGRYAISRARLVEVRGGVAIRSTNIAGTEDTLRVYRGELHKGDRRHSVMDLGTHKQMYRRGNELTSWSRSGRTAEAHYVLPDGLYVIGQDGEVFQVKRQAEQLLAQRRLESTQINIDQVVYPDGMATYGEADDWVLPTSTEAAVQPAGDGALAAALKKMIVNASAESMVPDQVEAPVPQPAVEAKPVEADVMTPEILAHFTNQSEGLYELISQLRILGDRPKLQSKDKLTDREKALLELYDKMIPDLNQAVRNLRGELAASEPRPKRIRGLVADLRGRVDRAWNKTGARMIPGYRANWVLQYRSAWERIPTVVDTEETAMLAVEMGAVKATLVVEARAELTKLIPRLQKEDAGAILDLPKIIADVANRLG